MKLIPIFFSTALLIASPAWAARYEIDPSHTTVGFKIRHMTISNVFGKFGQFGGSFYFDPSDIKTAKAEATIDVASIDTKEPKRDDHLRNPDFFDVAKFPQMTFKSRTVTPIDSSSFKVEGDITIRGVTKAVTLDVTHNGNIKDPWGAERAGFTASAKLNRKDFGLTWNKLLETGGLVVGDDVTITIELEGKKVA